MKTLTLCLLVACGQADPPQDETLTVWPENISAFVKENVRCAERPLGYTAKEMSSFSGYSYRLGYVSRLFRNAETLPQATNRLALRMLDQSYETALRTSLGILGSKASSGEAQEEASPDIIPVDEQSKKTWESLPQNVRRAVERLVTGVLGARPHLHKAFDWNALAQRTGDPNVRNLGSPQVYQHAAAPWLGYGGYSSSFAALNTFNSTSLGSASITALAAVRLAINDLLGVDGGSEVLAFDSCRLKTAVGTVRILGRGNNVYQGSDAIVIDLGGDDRYSGRMAVPISKDAPIGILIDVSGNDTYDGRSASASIACGLFGLGLLFDLGGHDKYYCRDSGLGCAWHGVGLLLDTVGDDLYSGNQWTQGAAHAGVGMLIDESGDDRYFCQLESQGLGATLGVGVLVDKLGNDRYHAYDNEGGRRITFPSSQTKSHEVSLVQGCGYGRRADSSDGRSLAGGVGALIDGQGDDTYYGGVFSQATGFWWSIGMLVDFGGNDRYRGVYYAQGAAAHFAIGSLVDHDGDDRYNDQRVLGQTLGAGRDGSVATFLDASGDDVYYIPKKSAGGGDMNSIGLFCDQQGADEYHPLTHSYMGAASFANPRGEHFRSRMPTIGIFADLAGEDKYPSHGRPKNSAKWHHQSSSNAMGFGLDTQPSSVRAKQAAESDDGGE